MEIQRSSRRITIPRYSPKGSCHLDETGMRQTLIQNCRCEFCCGMTRKRPQQQLNRMKWLKNTQSTVGEIERRQVRPEKWPAVLYLHELRGWKMEIQRSSRRITIPTWAGNPSCHLDETGMRHTLAQNCRCEFCCGMPLLWKPHQQHPNTMKWLIKI